jgi:hypothetical protein
MSGLEVLLSGSDGLVSPAGRWSWNVFGWPYSDDADGFVVGADEAGVGVDGAM